MTSAALSLRSRTSGRVARLGLAAAFVLLGMSVAVLLLVPRYSRPVALADVGTTAPDFHLRDTAGREVTLGDQRGRPVVLFFQSRATAQHYDARIEQLAQHFAGDGRVAFLGVEEPMALGTPDAAAELAADTIAPASLSTEQPFPTLVDDHGSVALRYSADTFPMVVVIDARGLVRYRGPIDDNADSAFVTRTFAADVLLDLLEERPTATIAARH
jgi:AhpC/TSA family